MIELQVSIENSVNEYPALNYGGYAYTLGFGPQIGPEFEKLDRRTEIRDYLYFADGKKESIRMKQEAKQVDRLVKWAAISGKYFAVIAVPDSTQYLIIYDTRPLQGVNEQSSLYFSRPEIKSSRNTDTFRFYIGPKKLDVLRSYNDAERNAYNLSDMQFDEIASRSVLIGWLVEILKFFLELFHRLIPNYGVAIILVTILLKVLLFPLTRKSYESTAKMQTLQPKMSELREKYKNNPQKLNQEMANMYKKEGVSPLGGCLPMLLQFPILIAFYSLLNTHFALRGAVFIPGWINDLSAPEAVITFSPIQITRNFQFDAIRALPFIMLVTTFLSSKLMQSPSTDASGRNMKMMTYMMPIMFFFILYNMPSGLLLYWTMQNIFTVAQQWYINYRRQKKNSGGDPGPGPIRKKK
jgi:YidC/Oxa1 family membrane protein insertase